MIHAEGGYPVIYPKWHKKRYDYYQKPSVYRRRVRWVCQLRMRRRWPSGIYFDPDQQWFDDVYVRPDREWGCLYPRQRRRRVRNAKGRG